MNAKLLPEQIVMRLIANVLSWALAWPIKILLWYTGTTRYTRAKYDEASDVFLFATTVISQFVWLSLLFWFLIVGLGL